MDGSFTFKNVSAGNYTFCARVPAEQAPSASELFLDTCAWQQPQTVIPVQAGKSVTGVQVAVPQGVSLLVRVNDPNKVLPSTVTGAAASGFDPQLQLIVRGPNRMVHRLPLQSQDVGGRSYLMIVPSATALSLSAQSSVAKLFDQNGQALQAEITWTTPAGATTANIQITAQHN